MKAKGGFYFVQFPRGKVICCRARGRIKDTGMDLLVGDMVEADTVEGVIEQIYPRKNSLVRPPVANVDQVVVFMSMSMPPLDLLLLNRILVAVEAAKLAILICLNKLDLIDPAHQEEINRVKKTLQGCGYRVILSSAVTGQGIANLKDCLKNRINVFAGPSGAGKSTLINKIKPGLQLQSAPVSRKTERGRHTTRHVELLEIDEDTYIVDTPGFQRMSLKGFSFRELPSFFPEIFSCQGACRFNSCLHNAEPGCAVKDAVQRGDIASWRYAHYLSFLREIQRCSISKKRREN